MQDDRDTIWVENERNGEGVYTGDLTVGSKLRHGFGRQTYPGGVTYKGEWFED